MVELWEPLGQIWEGLGRLLGQAFREKGIIPQTDSSVGVLAVLLPSSRDLPKVATGAAVEPVPPSPWPVRQPSHCPQTSLLSHQKKCLRPVPFHHLPLPP